RMIDEATRLTRSNQWLGTYEYMAPEAFVGRSGADHRADIYSFGIVAFQMLHGRLPFLACEPLILAEMHRKYPLPPFASTIPMWLITLLQACTKKKPSHRVQSMTEVKGVLAEGLTQFNR
ncbi:MAG: protein kinase, partial [Deltaproteobacteria bacterium]|nr:protein kinase [Deltaproteobacteria bacterium]